MTSMAGPSFLLVLLRGGHMAGLLSVLGALVFLRWMLPTAEDALETRINRLAAWSAGVALALGAAWFIEVAGEIADAHGLGQAIQSLPEVVAYMQFGQFLLARLVLLVIIVVLLAARRIRPAALLLAGVAIGLQPMLAHAGAMFGARGNVLVASEVIHMLAAGAWLGGLAPLLLCLHSAPAHAAGLLRRFSRLGSAAVLAIVVTGALQIWILAGGLTGLVGTTYGDVASLKVALFASALLFAALNRFVLTERLAASSLAATRLAFASVASEAVLGFCVVMAASWLASLAPGE